MDTATATYTAKNRNKARISHLSTDEDLSTATTTVTSYDDDRGPRQAHDGHDLKQGYGHGHGQEFVFYKSLQK